MSRSNRLGCAVDSESKPDTSDEGVENGRKHSDRRERSKPYTNISSVKQFLLIFGSTFINISSPISQLASLTGFDGARVYSEILFISLFTKLSVA